MNRAWLLVMIVLVVALLAFAALPLESLDYIWEFFSH